MQILNDRGPTVFAVTLVVITVATVFVVLRLISKWGVSRKANVDDYVIVVGCVFAVGLSVSIMIGTTVGLGAPDSEIKPEWYTPLKQCTYAFTVQYNPAIMATKTSILILYHRIASAHTFLRYASLFVMAIVNIAGIILTFIYIFQCRPIAAAFSLVDGTCVDFIALSLTSMPINVLTDVAILLLPLPILTSLRLQFQEKLILVATFILGGFVTIVDVVRVVFLQAALREELLVDPKASITATTRPPNFSYHASFSLMWSAVEVSVGIVCCCVVVLKPLVMCVMHKLLHHTVHSHRPSGTSDFFLHSEEPKDQPRSTDSNLHSDIPSPASITQPYTIPLSPRDVELTGIEPPMSPFSPTRPSLSVIQEQMINPAGNGGGKMLASEPQAEGSSGSPSTWPPQLDDTVARRKSSAARRSTFTTTSRRPTVQEPSHNFFDFVQVKSRVPLTQLSAKEAWWPMLFVTSLVFLWGFAAGLIGSFSAQLQNLLGYPPSRSITIHAAQSAYFFAPLLVGYWIFKYQGFKATFMTGLAIFATGALSFWPSSILRSYAGYFVSNFIVFFGLACLEVAADPFIALAGPGELSEARLNFAQGFYGIAYIVSPIIAQAALFSGSAVNQDDLFRVQWYYLAVALFALFLAMVFYYVPLSEVSDDDLEAMALQRLYNAGLDPEDKAYGIGARHLLLWSGVVAMWLYVNNQGVIDYYWTALVQDINPDSQLDVIGSQSVARGIFTFGRFVAAGLCFVGIPPRITIGISMLGAFVTSILAFVLPPGNAAMAMLLLYSFFEGPIFPTLFAMIMRGQGRHTKFAASATVMTILGGMIGTTIVYGIQLRHPSFSRPALLVVTISFGISMIWAVLISSSRVLRRWVDPKWSKHPVTAVGEQGRASAASQNEKAVTAHLELQPLPGETAECTGIASSIAT